MVVPQILSQGRSFQTVKTCTINKKLGLQSSKFNTRPQRKFLIVSQAAEETETPTVQASASEETTTVEVKATPSEVPQNQAQEPEEGFVPVSRLEDIPKGVRKEVRVDQRNVLLFWYRNDLFAIQARSPAEGAYSEGFIAATFTQDYGIQCPSTKSVFSLKTGEILDWYPDNPVLRTLTPQDTCRPLEIYPVKIADDTVYVNVGEGSLGGVQSPATRGGTTTSAEQNNVFGLQPQVYVQGGEQDESKGQVFDVSSFATLVVAFSAITLVGTVGTAVSLFYEDYVLLGLFWAVILVVGGFFGYQFVSSTRQQQ